MRTAAVPPPHVAVVFSRVSRCLAPFRLPPQRACHCSSGSLPVSPLKTRTTNTCEHSAASLSCLCTHLHSTCCFHLCHEGLLTIFGLGFLPSFLSSFLLSPLVAVSSCSNSHFSPCVSAFGRISGSTNTGRRGAAMRPSPWRPGEATCRRWSGSTATAFRETSPRPSTRRKRGGTPRWVSCHKKEGGYYILWTYAR